MKMKKIVLMAFLMAFVLLPLKGVTIDINNLSEWDGLEDKHFVDAAGDQSGSSIDLLGIWLVHDDNYMYIRWDAKLPGNQDQMVSTAFGLGFSNVNSDIIDPPPTRDCVFWVAFDSAGTVTQVSLADASSSVSVPAPITDNVARFGEGANGNYVTLVSKIPWSLFIDLGYGNITADTAFPMWGERLASGSFTANVQDRVPDDGFFFYNAGDDDVSAIGGTYSGEKDILTYSLPGQTGVAVIDDVAGTTIASASTYEKDMKDVSKTIDGAAKLGEIMGKRLLEKKISTVVFDRNGYLYHGVVKAMAEGARKAGIQF